MKTSKKVLTIIIVIIGLIIVFGAAFYFRYQQMANTINSVELYSLDLANIKDDVYQGEYSEFLVQVKLEVTVKDHKITSITMLDQRAGPGYEALETIDQIIGAQSVEVDGVSGATASSKSIMIAVQNALQQK
jgi:uncharacterized protein with FMN-binding domain